MSQANPVVFDISSDEETSFEGTNVRDDEDPYWLSALLGIVEKERKVFDDDEVVVVEDYQIKSKSTKIGEDDDDDDDCVVLESDPEKVVDVNGGDGGDGDDVVFVGQKGQIACRDYPHPRHDCAKFPFSSTPHESHCDLCHCYVCDLHAPCAFWGTGLSAHDHCHATNKSKSWKSQRENLRLQKNGTHPVLKCLNPPSSVVASPMPQMSPSERVTFDAIQSELCLLIQNQAPQPTTIRACSTGGMAVPNIISRGRNTDSGYGQGRNELVARFVPGQIAGVQPNVIRQDTVPNLGQPSCPSNKVFKKPAIIRGALATNQAAQYSSNNMNCAPAPQHRINTVPPPTSVVQTPIGRPDILAGQTLGYCAFPRPTEPSIGSFIANPTPPQPQVYDPPGPQSNNQGVYQCQNVVVSRSDVGLSWGNGPGLSNQQTSVENIPLNGVGNNNVPSPVNDFSSTQFDNCENWFSSHSVAQPGRFSSDLNAFCPEPPAIDAGMLYFDYDPSFNGLAQM